MVATFCLDLLTFDWWGSWALRPLGQLTEGNETVCSFSTVRDKQWRNGREHQRRWRQGREQKTGAKTERRKERIKPRGARCAANTYRALRVTSRPCLRFISPSLLKSWKSEEAAGLRTFKLGLDWKPTEALALVLFPEDDWPGLTSQVLSLLSLCLLSKQLLFLWRWPPSSLRGEFFGDGVFAKEEGTVGGAVPEEDSDSAWKASASGFSQYVNLLVTRLIADNCSWVGRGGGIGASTPCCSAVSSITIAECRTSSTGRACKTVLLRMLVNCWAFLHNCS